MFKGREILHIVVAIIVVAFVMGFFDIDKFVYYLIAGFVLFAISIFAKKILAYYLDVGTETSIWHVKRYGFHGSSEFVKPLPFGIILPVVIAFISAAISFFSFGVVWVFPWLAITEFDVRALKARASKKIGLYRYSELTESHIGLIAAVGIVSCLIAAILAYLLNFPEFAKLCVYFSCYNMLPLGNLDGSKIFFGSFVLWCVLAVFCVLGLGYALI